MTALNAETWREILADYDALRCCKEEDEIGWFQSQPSLRAAIETAARAVKKNGRRFSHQYRIRRQAIIHATAALLAAEAQIRRAGSFDRLIEIVTGQLRDVSGTGELYCYDTSFRIGAYLGVFPERVYLHAGTRAGARALGLAAEKDALEINEVPAALRKRKPHEVEDILCIYKDRFRGAKMPVKGCAPRRPGRIC